MKILIGGDIVPTENNYKEFAEGDVEKLIGSDLVRIFERADFKILNLEVPLSNQIDPIVKCGPNLVAPENTINGLKKINSDFYCLANNHILDQGEKGLMRTMQLLQDNNIGFAGAGRNLEEAQKPYIYECKGMSIGVYCCAEHEFTIATEKSAGANPYEPLDCFDHVLDLKEKCDYVIVLYHGGKEFYRYPSPNVRKIFKKFAEKGADLVISQHSHCIGCYEKYKNSTLVYGQGNFLFSRVHDEYWDTAVLIDIELNSSGKNKIEFEPIVSIDNCVRMAQGDVKIKILEEFEERSNRILVDGFVEQNYNEYTRVLARNYSRIVKGERSFLSQVYMKIFDRSFDYLYKNNRILALLNFLECEAHREVVLNEIKRCVKEMNNENS